MAVGIDGTLSKGLAIGNSCMQTGTKFGVRFHTDQRNLIHFGIQFGFSSLSREEMENMANTGTTLKDICGGRRWHIPELHDGDVMCKILWEFPNLVYE